MDADMRQPRGPKDAFKESRVSQREQSRFSRHRRRHVCLSGEPETSIHDSALLGRLPWRFSLLWVSFTTISIFSMSAGLISDRNFCPTS